MRFSAGQQRAADIGMTDGFADLLPKTLHVGIEPHAQQHCRVDLARGGVGCGVIEQRRQIVKVRHENPEAS